MNEVLPEATEATAKPPRKGWAVLAWLVILLLVGFEVVYTRLRAEAKPAEEAPVSDLLTTQIQARYMVGSASLFDQGPGLLAQARGMLNTGPLANRLYFVVVAGEMGGPKEALQEIKQIEQVMTQQGVEPPESSKKVLEVLQRLYQDRVDGHPGAPSLSDADRDLLRRELNWTGRLALTPHDAPDQAARAALIGQARRTAGVMLGVGTSLVVFGLVGVMALIICLALMLAGKLRPLRPRPTGHGAVYAEGFAVYMLTFLLIALGRSFLPFKGYDLELAAGGMVAALVAGLAWPVLRGIPWRQVRQDVGFTFGPTPVREVFLGLFGYMLALPFFGIGLVFTVLLMGLQRQAKGEDNPQTSFAPLQGPTHPIIQWITGSDWWTLALIILVASVLAPLVEETMFRGFLYRQLRDATWGLGRIVSYVVCALLVSFVFAVIHPQGLVAVPALMGLAMGLNLLREWRSSLVPSMIVHGVHNGLMTFLLTQVLRG